MVDTHKTLLVLLVKSFGGLMPPFVGFLGLGGVLAVRSPGSQLLYRWDFFRALGVSWDFVKYLPGGGRFLPGLGAAVLFYIYRCRGGGRVGLGRRFWGGLRIFLGFLGLGIDFLLGIIYISIIVVNTTSNLSGIGPLFGGRVDRRIIELVYYV